MNNELEVLKPVQHEIDELRFSEQNQFQTQSKCENCSDDYFCDLCIAAMKIDQERASSKSNLNRQASRMLERSNSKFPVCKVGDTVRVAIPDVDRGRGDFRNILMSILEVNEKGFYKLGNYHGTVEELFSRNQFTPTNAIHLDASKISSDKKSLRQLSTLQSKFGGQGYQRCHCKGGCKSKKCSCKQNGVLCNSKCHSSLPCNNK